MERIAIDKKYYLSCARVFSPIVINSLIDTRSSEYLVEVLKSSGISDVINPNITMAGFFKYLYHYLLKSYRNEYIYKSAITNKILLGRHSLNTSCMLTEFRTANCKADVVILNGTSTVYEIKSEYDNLDRLYSQILSYSDVFDRINVITSDSQLARVEKEMPSNIGLMILTKRNSIRTIREAQSGKEKVKPEIIFDSLRKQEYLSIIKKLFGYIPDVPNTLISRECKKLFCDLSPVVAHDEMVKILYQRGSNRILKDFINNVPDSLKAYVISAKIDKNRILRLFNLLKNKLSDILVPVTTC